MRVGCVMANEATLPRLVTPDGEPFHELVVVVEQRRPRYMRVKDCAADLRCCKSYVHSLIKTRKLRAIRLGRLVLVSTDDWDAYLDTAVPVEET